MRATEDSESEESERRAHFERREDATVMGRYIERIEKGFIDSSFEQSGIANCLDVACGRGRHSLLLSRKGIEVFSLDYDMPALVLLKERMDENAKDRILIIRGDGIRLPFMEGSFDGILSNQFVGYVDIRIFLSECHRALKPDGYLLFNIANRHSYKNMIFRKLNPESEYRFYGHSFNEVVALLAEFNFRVERTIGYNWIPFGRSSESRLIGVSATFERLLGLGKLPSMSPHVYYFARKMA
jgi:SAM-dependent methyltransferase